MICVKCRKQYQDMLRTIMVVNKTREGEIMDSESWYLYECCGCGNQVLVEIPFGECDEYQYYNVEKIKKMIKGSGKVEEGEDLIIVW